MNIGYALIVAINIGMGTWLLLNEGSPLVAILAFICAFMVFVAGATE